MTFDACIFHMFSFCILLKKENNIGWVLWWTFPFNIISTYEFQKSVQTFLTGILTVNQRNLHSQDITSGGKTTHYIILSLQTNAKSRLNISSLQPYTTYKFQIRRKINRRIGLWSDWSQPKQAKTKEEGKLWNTLQTFIKSHFVILEFLCSYCELLIFSLLKSSESVRGIKWM